MFVQIFHNNWSLTTTSQIGTNFRISDQRNTRRVIRMTALTNQLHTYICVYVDMYLYMSPSHLPYLFTEFFIEPENQM